MNELNGPDASRKMAKLLNKNYLSPKKRSDVLLAAGECKTWTEVLIRYEKLLVMILVNNGEKFTS